MSFLLFTQIKKCVAPGFLFVAPPRRHKNAFFMSLLLGGGGGGEKKPLMDSPTEAQAVT